MNSQEFNANWKVFVHWQDLNCPLGFENLVNLLDDAAQRTFERLNRFKGDKLIVRPFHGAVMYFYRR